jgi:hypothetical protein
MRIPKDTKWWDIPRDYGAWEEGFRNANNPPKRWNWWSKWLGKDHQKGPPTDEEANAEIDALPDNGKEMFLKWELQEIKKWKEDISRLKMKHRRRLREHRIKDEPEWNRIWTEEEKKQYGL